ncbi:MAG: HAD hydrolase-like protein, partial [Hyphomicrobiales bacterium]|nr:HAD hydrolase-like protein [Hyphomicrobiales bacterium]
DCHDCIATSGDATLALIAAQGGGRALHLGPARDRVLFEAARRADPATAPTLAPLAQADFVVCTGLDEDEVETVGDYAGRLAQMRARDLQMICANPDLWVHRGERLIPCAGALAAEYEKLGGRTLLAGKPHAPIYELAVAEAERARRGTVARSRILAVGDGLHTDMAGAARQGFDALLVAGGLHRDELTVDGEIGPGAAARLAAAGVAPKLAIARLVW